MDARRAVLRSALRDPGSSDAGGAFSALVRRFFGSANDRRIRGYRRQVDAINALEPEIAALSDAALKKCTAEFRKQLAAGRRLDDILVAAFATVREAAKRTLGQRHFDVQLVGGLVLHEGDIAEIKIGEDRRLASTLAIYLNALAGKGVHVVGVSDDRVKQDSEWMGQIYQFLGLTTGAIVHGLDDGVRQRAYACDITYGTHHEFGFDYLRDNMKYRPADMVQRGQACAIVDEADAILIDAARTPLITVGPENQTLISITVRNYFRIYEKLAGMTGSAATEADELLEVYGLEVVEIPTNAAIHRLDEADEVYRTGDEKYAAVLAEVERANSRLQPVLIGAVSIEKSDALAEYLKEHGYRRIDVTDQNAVEELYNAARAGKPARLFAVLDARSSEQTAYIVALAGVPGAITIAASPAIRDTDIRLGGSLEMRIDRETAGIVDEAEKPVKIERIKADVERFRDTVLEAEEVVEVEPARGGRPAKTAIRPSGLYVIGVERHESRRVDDQLRDCSGIRGDPGRSKFILSLEDELMQGLERKRLDATLARLGVAKGGPILHPWVRKEIERERKKIQMRRFDIRINELKFDDIQNDQRKVVFEQRLALTRDENIAATVAEMRHVFIEEIVAKYAPDRVSARQWDAAGLKEKLKRTLDIDLPVEEWASEGIAGAELASRVAKYADERMAAKVAQWGRDVMRYVEKTILLQTIDHLWRQHLVMLENPDRIARARGPAQGDPLQDYATEAFNLFETMMAHLREAVTAQLLRVAIVPEKPAARAATNESAQMPDAGKPADAIPVSAATATRDPKIPASWAKVDRNEDCPCGSGRKYKHCHGRPV